MKQKELPTEGEFAFNLESVELGQDEDGDPVTSCVVTECDAEPTASGPKLTGKALVGLRKLADCIIDQGVILPPSRHVPSHVTGVTLDQWRDYLQKAGIISDGNPREQFRRIKDKLIETRQIAIWGNLVWLVRKVSHSTNARRGPNFHNTGLASQVQSEPWGVPGAKSRAGMRLSEVASALCGPDLFLACRFPRRSPFPACRVATLRP